MKGRFQGILLLLIIAGTGVGVWQWIHRVPSSAIRLSGNGFLVYQEVPDRRGPTELLSPRGLLYAESGRLWSASEEETRARIKSTYGGREAKLPPQSAANEWSPDGTKLLYRVVQKDAPRPLLYPEIAVFDGFDYYVACVDGKGAITRTVALPSSHASSRVRPRFLGSDGVVWGSSRELSAFPIETGKPRSLFKASDGDGVDAAFPTADGRWLALIVRPASGQEGNQLWVVDAQDGQSRRVPRLEEKVEGFPIPASWPAAVWSADGTCLAVAFSETVSLVARTAHLTPVRLGAIQHDVAEMLFSPDNRYLLVRTTWYQVSCVGHEPYEAVTIFDTRKATQVYHERLPDDAIPQLTVHPFGWQYWRGGKKKVAIVY
jgi:hypothetical protein